MASIEFMWDACGLGWLGVYVGGVLGRPVGGKERRGLGMGACGADTGGITQLLGCMVPACNCPKGLPAHDSSAAASGEPWPTMKQKLQWSGIVTIAVLHAP